MSTATWDDVYVTVIANCLIAEKHFQIRFHVEDDDNYAVLILWPNTVPHIPCGTWELRQIVAGVSILIDSGNLDQFDLDTYYTWRVLFKKEGTNLIYQIYQDENLLSSQAVVYPVTWSTSGHIAMTIEPGGEVHVSKVKVTDFPMPYDFLGPS